MERKIKSIFEKLFRRKDGPVLRKNRIVDSYFFDFEKPNVSPRNRLIRLPDLEFGEKFHRK